MSLDPGCCGTKRERNISASVNLPVIKSAIFRGRSNSDRSFKVLSGGLRRRQKFSVSNKKSQTIFRKVFDAEVESLKSIRIGNNLESEIRNNPNEELIVFTRPRNVSDIAFICKICYDKEEQESNKLITPCVCQGSLKYIHHDCLKTWIVKQELNRPEHAKCEICKTPYTMVFKIKNVFSKTRCCKFTERLVTLLFVSMLILVVFSVVVFMLITKSSEMSEKNKCYLIMGLFFGSFVTLAAIFIFAFRKFREFCYKKELEDWRILSLNELDGSTVADNTTMKMIQYTTNVFINNYFHQGENTTNNNN